MVTKKGGAVKHGVSRKGESTGHTKTLPLVEAEDVEVNLFNQFV